MVALVVIMLLLSLVSFLVAAVLAHVAPTGRLSAITFLSLGLAFWVAVELLGTVFGVVVVR